MTSAVAETRIVADIDGSNTGDAGEVRWTGYDGASDAVAPSGTGATLNLAARDFLTFECITFVGGKAATGIIDGNTAISTNIKFTDCTFLAGSLGSASLIGITGSANLALNWTIDRCSFLVWAAGSSIVLTLITSALADYDVNVQIRNCRIVGGAFGVFIGTFGGDSFKPGGVDVLNCDILGIENQCVLASGSDLSTSIPCTVYNCLIGSGSTGLSATTLGEILEDYNIIQCGTARTNVTAGTHSIANGSYSLLLEIGQDRPLGRRARPFLTPAIGSPLLGFDNHSGAPTVDMLNRPRPAGGASILNAVGCLERHDTARVGSALGSDTLGYLEIVGPGDQDLYIAVDPVPTVLTIKVRWDASHGDGNKPQAILLAAPEIAVVTETKTATGTAGSSYETLTFSSITPTVRGVVTLRLVSRSAAAGGIAAWDTLNVAV